MAQDLESASWGVETGVAPWPNGPIRLDLVSEIGSEMLTVRVENAVAEDGAFEDNKEDLESQEGVQNLEEASSLEEPNPRAVGAYQVVT